MRAWTLMNMAPLAVIIVLFVLLALLPLLVVPEDTHPLLTKNPGIVVFVGALCVFIVFG